MYCNQCGAKLKEGARFCTRCGANQEEPASAPASQEAGADSGIQAANPVSREESFLKKWLICAAALTVVFAISLYMVMSGEKKPQNIAERYFVNLVNGNADGAFDCLGLKETEWLNPEMFEAHIRMEKDDDEKLAKARSVRISPDHAMDGSRSFSVSYTYGDSYVEGYYIVSLNNVNGNWCVSYPGLIAHDISIRIPKGAVGKLNGQEIKEEYFEEDASSQEYDAYLIPEMFAGQYTLEVDQDGYLPFVKLADVTTDEASVTVSQNMLKISEETVRELENLARKDMETLYSAVLVRKDFSEVKDLFAGDAEKMASLKKDYDSKVEYYEGRDSINSVQFSNMEAQGKTSDTTVIISFDRDLDYNLSTYRGTTKSSSSDSSADWFDFVRDDGEWKLSRVPDLQIYVPYSYY